jgi:hypothetical protein
MKKLSLDEILQSAGVVFMNRLNAGFSDDIRTF